MVQGARRFHEPRSPTPQNACPRAGRRDRGVPARRHDSADINAIVEAAGVFAGYVYFHFPTKEHVLLELIRRDEAHLAGDSADFSTPPTTYPRCSTRSSRVVLALENNGLRALFRDVIGLYFSPRGPKENVDQHPTFVLLAAEIDAHEPRRTLRRRRPPMTVRHSFWSAFTRNSSAPACRGRAGMTCSRNS